MKKMILISIGLLPLIAGCLLNYLMVGVFTDTALPLLLIGIVFLAAWGFLGRWSRTMAMNRRETMLLAHSIPIAVWLLICVQVLAMGHFWENPIGFATQIYYLPLMNLAARLIIVPITVSMAQLSAIALLLMWAAFYLGCRGRKR